MRAADDAEATFVSLWEEAGRTNRRQTGRAVTDRRQE